MVKAMDTLHSIQFPIYKLGKHTEIKRNPVGPIYITTIRDTYILDDLSYPGDLGRRRRQIKENKYPLKETVFSFRDMVKFPSGTTFIDNTGKIFKYVKGNSRYIIKCKKVYKKELRTEGMVCYIEDVPTPVLLSPNMSAQTKDYASVLYTEYGPILYDLVQEYHEPYRRSI